MSDISVEQRLLLLRSIREAEDKNRMNLRQHENLLYGAGRQNELTEPVYGTQDVPARHFFHGSADFCSHRFVFPLCHFQLYQGQYFFPEYRENRPAFRRKLPA